MTVDTKELVTTIAYLIGVKKHIIEQCFDAECHDTLQKLYAHKEATTIRYLCKLRTTLFQKFKKTDTEMRYNLTAASLRSAFRRHGEVISRSDGYSVFKEQKRSRCIETPKGETTTSL